ncbi:MAG: hypothetical protein NT027_02725 [Proteobacteria bacterium]|nr:hypothetical protein [Pseudomonadota bacterium]
MTSILMFLASIETSIWAESKGKSPERTRNETGKEKSETQNLITNENVFENIAAGVKFEKLSGWNYSSIQTWQDRKLDVTIQDKELEKLIRERASVPIFIALKYKEPSDKMNPALQLLVRPIGGFAGMSPVEIMNQNMKTMKTLMKEFKIVKEPASVQIGGLAAATASFSMRVDFPSAEKPSFPVSKTWFVPSGKMIYIIGASGILPEDSETEKEVDGMVQTFVFAKKTN